MVDYVRETLGVDPDLYKNWLSVYRQWVIDQKKIYPPLISQGRQNTEAVFVTADDVSAPSHIGSRKVMLAYKHFRSFVMKRGVRSIYYLGAKTDYLHELTNETDLQLRLFDPRFTLDEVKGFGNKKIKLHRSKFSGKTIKNLSRQINSTVAVFDDTLEVSGVSDVEERLKHLAEVESWHNEMSKLGVKYWCWKMPECAFARNVLVPAERIVYKTPENHPSFSNVRERRVITTSDLSFTALTIAEYDNAKEYPGRLIDELTTTRYDLKLMEAKNKKEVSMIINEMKVNKIIVEEDEEEEEAVEPVPLSREEGKEEEEETVPYDPKSPVYTPSPPPYVVEDDPANRQSVAPEDEVNVQSVHSIEI